jgi:Flp pilus assembly protein CpaB
MPKGPKTALTRDQKYKKKIKLKRLLSKTFDKGYNKKKAIAQATYRRNKKQKLNEQTITTSSLATDLRKKEGERRSRVNTKTLKIENMKFRERILELEKEMKQLNLSLRSINENSPHETPTLSPAKLLMSNLSPSAKKRVKLRIMNRKENLRRGKVCTKSPPTF